jgi:hypothetical protein
MTAPSAPSSKFCDENANLLQSKITSSFAAHRKKTNLPEPMNNLAQQRINPSSGTDSKFTAARRAPLMPV